MKYCKHMVYPVVKLWNFALIGTNGTEAALFNLFFFVCVVVWGNLSDVTMDES